MLEESARFEGSIPAIYDRFLVPMIFEPFSRDLAGRVMGRPGKDLLEIACGTGVVTQEVLKALGPEARVTATDLNPGMIEVAQERVGPDPRLRWQTADATELPFANESFDTLFCQFGVMFFPDKPGAFRQARRVLRRGGRLVFNTWDRIEENPFAQIAHQTVAGFFDDGPPEFYKIPFGFHDVDVVTSMLEGADFGEIEIKSMQFKARSASATDAAQGLVRGNPILLPIQERGLDLAPIVDAVALRLAERGGDRPMELPMKAWVVTAVAK